MRKMMTVLAADGEYKLRNGYMPTKRKRALLAFKYLSESAERLGVNVQERVVFEDSLSGI